MTQTTQSRQTYSAGELDQRREFDRSRPLERDETNRLISSDKVRGTSVYSTSGDKLGSVDHLMIGKRSGRVEYAVMSFGGFLGMGEQYHPLPWDALDYDTDRDGYVVDMSKEKLEKAPTFERDDQPTWDRDYGETVYTYYGVIY
ncbi:PRC-barrel domain-containing protein [Croceibacterium aestuarii]|uniref:PRC-barrel domain-containing protein n=1 Tax=Croceibacterium aestuarii TaxID=3064139 RepID=UPI00272ECFF2|nr:PRC-barrel domain-containing protein [Croceibacterium sp. D39]